MYEEFYGLSEKPFSLTPDPRFFFLSEHHREAFEHLLYGIQEREGFILITGEVGAGKTTLCRVLLNKIDSTATNTALILNPMFSEQELLQCILGDFGVRTTATTKKKLLDNLNKFLLNQQAANRNSILIIDEAQNLSPAVLEEIRILSNLETEKEKLLQIILMGQIELKEKLSLPQLRQLNQRISVRYHLQTLGKEEVPRYVQHRLTVAGSSGDIHFTSGAVQEIYSYSQGIPRLINLAADRALLAGYAEQSREIKHQTVARGLKSLNGEATTLSHGLLRPALAQGLAGLATFCLGLVAAALLLGHDNKLFEKLSGIRESSSSATSAEAKVQPEKIQGVFFYALQLGSYATEAEALEVAEGVKATGYPLFLAKMNATDGTNLHGLYLGRFTERAEAEKVENTFKKEKGFSGIRLVLTSSRPIEKIKP